MSKINKKLIEKLNNQTSSRVYKKINELPHFSEMKNIVSAAKLLIKLLLEGKRGILIGDYDVDGIMASVILIHFMNELGFTREVFDVHIPSRLKDGYGLSPNVVERCINDGYDFIVTVDNGIAAIEAIAMAKEAGMTVIVTDHHTAPKILPNADIIVCPKQPGETFPFVEISGATVAWYFVAAIKDEMNFDINLGQYLDYVALTIMSDVMPLTDINLPLLEYGLNIIKSRKRHIYKLQWREQWTHKNEIDETALSFGLVPKFNAVGRIDDANLAIDLLLSKDKREIEKLFSKVNMINEKRKLMSRANTLEAEDLVNDDIVFKDKNLVFAIGDWHEGVVGIIAGRLAEKYKRPAYVMSYSEEKGLYKGSARTSGNVHLYDLTVHANSILAGWGGHAGAVGFGVTEGNVKKFEKILSRECDKFDPDIFINHFLDPIHCNLSDINSETFDIVRRYGPYGQSNPMPTFIANMIIVEQSPISDGLHWKVKLQDPHSDYVINGMMFNVHPSKILEDSKGHIALIDTPIDLKFNLSKAYDSRTDTYKLEIFASFID